GHYRAVHSHEANELIMPFEQQIGKRVPQVLPHDAAEICMAAIREASTSGYSAGWHYGMQTSNGSKQWFELSVARKPTEPGEEVRLIAIARNITERKIAEEAIQHMAFHDSLTGLPNRRMLADRLQTAVATCNRYQRHGALLFLDLDQFKDINDHHGHEAGDVVLQEVARRLLQSVRGIDTVARLGGDEFVVLIQDLSAQADEARIHAAAVGHKILSSLNEPYPIASSDHLVTPSIGATLFDGGAAEPSEILKYADSAMYRAKSEGKNRLCFFEKDGA
ncbi:MAG: diguanylate cyclase domain-containing protein, partial [Rhodoferax sp.]